MNKPTFKILDCTLRDGSLTNKSAFSIETARDIFQASCKAGLDYIELGYRNSSKILSRDEYGPLQFCTPETVNCIVSSFDRGRTKISLMQDAHKAIPEDIEDKRNSAVDMIRIATYLKDLDRALLLADNAITKGYTCSINIMAISTIDQNEISAILQRISTQTAVEIIYLVDSYGALLPLDLERLFKIFNNYTNRFKFGVHFHNSLQLAFANTLKSISLGADIVDTTLLGLGRGSGNCPTELVVDNALSGNYNLRPLLKPIQDHILPLRDSIKWGYHIPYMLAGNRNLHPAKAADWLRDKNLNDLIDCFDQLNPSE